MNKHSLQYYSSHISFSSILLELYLIYVNMTTVSITKSLKKTNKVFQNASLKTEGPFATRNEDVMLPK